jgi:hypothetical protein
MILSRWLVVEKMKEKERKFKTSFIFYCLLYLKLTGQIGGVGLLGNLPCRVWVLNFHPFI